MGRLDTRAAADPTPENGYRPGAANQSEIQKWLDSIVPEPNLTDEPSRSVPPGTLAPDLAALWRAVQPTPSGDAFFDEWPADLTRYAPGDVIARRDVTAAAAPQLMAPIRSAVLLKYRTADSAGAPSFATATLLEPAAQWTGTGTRPVLVNALPINSLGLTCTPGYAMAHGDSGQLNGLATIPPTNATALSRGYAVLLPDHEGPRMAYAEPTVAGHAILDGIRAVRAAFHDEYRDSRYALAGYSGGAIAAAGAAMSLDEYAPELKSVLVGAAVGGLITDTRRIARSFDGGIESGILLSVVLAHAREHPEILGAMNNLAQQVATSPLKNICGSSQGILGAVGIPLELGATLADPLTSPLADAIFERTDMQDKKSGIPLYIYHAADDLWVPADGARELHRRQCALGVPSTLRLDPGEHVTGLLTTFPGAMSWLDQRLQGVPAPNGC
ncbi:lipase family protein [Nocardia sp. NPDC088792]|uniref:lipase family protein n=1 Tax=Nocardia sp. NPDC088792 TaxID=3364332 RepID=UPI00381F20E4